MNPALWIGAGLLAVVAVGLILSAVALAVFVVWGRSAPSRSWADRRQ